MVERRHTIREDIIVKQVLQLGGDAAPRGIKPPVVEIMPEKASQIGVVQLLGVGDIRPTAIQIHKGLQIS